MHSAMIRALAVSTALSLTFVACANRPARAAGRDDFRWVDDPQAGTTTLMHGEQPVIRYMHAYDASTPERVHETYKVYHHVFGPGTATLITKGAGGKYTHHRGLYVGWNKTITADGKSYDFWHCTRGAHQRHVRFLEKKADADGATMTAEIHWNDPEGQPVIVEKRTVAVTTSPGDSAGRDAWQIDWKTTLESRRDEIRLEGDRQHAGFQYRAAQHVAETNGARFIRPEGFPQQKQAFQVGDKGDPPPHIDLGWFAMSYELDGTTYTVEYFEHPSLPKPSLYSERPYGRFGAFFKTKLTEDEPLTMQYRVRVSSGDPPSQDAIRKRYDGFVAALKQAEQGS